MKKILKKDYQQVQRLFCKIRLKDYFSYLYNTTQNEMIKDDFKFIKQYTNLDENYIYDFSDWINTDFDDNITIGEILRAAYKMMREDEYSSAQRKEAEETAFKIINVLLLKPLPELAAVYKENELEPNNEKMEEK